jgi:cytochrome c-type biogenesis protein CcsB
MAIAILTFALAMAIATFIENDYGTPSAKAIIYNTKWFELLMLILVVNFIGNIFKYRLFRKEKWPVFLFHIAFIITLLGSFITRYYGYEGVMLIREGEVASSIRSDRTYVDVRIDNNKVMKNYQEHVLYSQLGKNSYSLEDDFGVEDQLKTPFSIEMINFVANAKETLVEDKAGENYLHLVESSTGIRKDIYLKSGDIKNIRNILFTYNNPIDGGMNFSSKAGKSYLQPLFNGTYMEMQTQQLTDVKKDSVANLQIKKLYTFDNLRFVVKSITRGNVIKESAPKNEQETHPYDALTFKIKSGNDEKIIDVRGAKGAILGPEKIKVNDLNFNISYGSKEIKTPFSIKLRDFELERYPGTNSASSYASEVTVIDKDKTFDFRIFMNHVLDHKGFRFFQSSYDQDEKGTVLSVNHDYWGTLVTYIGYLLMGIGMFFSLFLRGSRFKDVSEKLKKLSEKKAVILLVFLSLSMTSFAQEKHNHAKSIPAEELQKQAVSKAHADKFGRLLIQDHQGRIKPINTYALEALRKVYKKDTYKGLTAEQILLSAQLNPKLWSVEPIIKAYSVPLGSKITKDLEIKDKHTSMMNFFNEKGYYLEQKVANSFRKKNSNRNATDKEIINLDERANIWYNVLNGGLMHIYPKKGDQNNKWYLGTDKQIFVAQDSMVLKMHQIYLQSLIKAIKTNDYKEADHFLEIISEYQHNLGSKIIPSAKKVDLEIKYNRWNIFTKLMFYYMLIGFIFLILAFVDLFKPNSKITKKLLKLFTILTILGMIVHAGGMGLRWYITGHEPWSNGYEAVIFVGFITTLAGLIFTKPTNTIERVLLGLFKDQTLKKRYDKSKFPLAATVLFASFLLAIAHGSLMSPEMTNLVPVLKSYWLMIHVAIITASYGFLGLGALLGFIVLLLFILRTKENEDRFNDTIKELSYINESTVTVGLFALSIGTFLGGVWANESWGRYWSWDPKEVWALISMMVYIFVLHMRLVPGLRGRFAFNFASMISIATLIMTFFGVNYYLSGMHSYAKGDPVPIPVWIYYFIGFVTIFSIISYKKYRSYKKD